MAPKIDLCKYLTMKNDDTGALSFMEEDYHENFGFQWTRFNKLQLDSYNGSSESKDRLLHQSEMVEDDFKDKVVLEIGAGNGRFTEVLLQFGAKVIAVDYSSAINANYNNHIESVNKGDLICMRADLFNMPIKKNVFDIVICYGVIQHTGDNKRCLNILASFVGPSGFLLADIYSNSLKHFNPWIYLIRPVFSRIKGSASSKMQIVVKFVDLFFPIQLKILKFLHNKAGLFRYIKYLVNRSPNSVDGINLFLDKKISLKDAKDWSICDTYDAWMPKHDDPVSFKQWKRLLSELDETSDLSVVISKQCGQGNCAVLEMKKSNT